MKLPNGAWVFVLDGAKALMLENVGDRARLDLRVHDHEARKSLSTGAQGADRPGRYPGPGARRSAVEQTDWRALDERRFVAHLADEANAMARDGVFERFLVIADPRSLGEIRKHLSETARTRLVGELPLDLAHRTIDAIERAIDAAPEPAA